MTTCMRCENLKDSNCCSRCNGDLCFDCCLAERKCKVDIRLDIRE
jgi:hypothetical protein